MIPTRSPPPCVPCQASHVMCHMSSVTRRVSIFSLSLNLRHRVAMSVCLCHCEKTSSRSSGDSWSNCVLLILSHNFFFSVSIILVSKKKCFWSLQTTLLYIMGDLARGRPVSHPVWPLQFQASPWSLKI